MNTDFDVDAFFRRVIERYGDMLYRVSHQYVGNKQDAEDVLQEVFLLLNKYIKKNSFKEEEHMKAWLIRATIHKSINTAKYNARHRTAQLDERLCLREEGSELKQIIDKLVPLDREIVYLHYYEGYPIKDIAVFVHRNEKVIYKRLSRARKKLKEYITERREP